MLEQLTQYLLDQNILLAGIPASLSAAAALLREKYALPSAIGIGALSDLVEPIGRLPGVGFANLAEPLLPRDLALAAGARLSVIVHEILPRSHHGDFFARAATAGVIGFVTMMFPGIYLG